MPSKQCKLESRSQRKLHHIVHFLLGFLAKVTGFEHYRVPGFLGHCGSREDPRDAVDFRVDVGSGFKWTQKYKKWKQKNFLSKTYLR